MRFSLVLATVGRVSEVQQFLESLDSQSYRKFELIVVDQNQDDRLVPLVETYRERFSIFHLGSDAGLSRARNAGLRYVTGDVAAFPDDDCRYPPKLLERIAGFFRERPELDGLTGRLTDERGRSGTARFDKKPGVLSLANAWKRAASVTLFLRRDVVETVGKFDEALGAGAGTLWGGGEDIDYALRAVECGFELLYRPDIAVLHPSLPEHDYSKLAERAYGYGAGIGRVWRKHDYPLWLVAYYLLRPVGGAALSTIQGRKDKARYHFSALRGRLRGWLFS